MGKNKKYRGNVAGCSRNSNIFRLTIVAVFLVLASSVFIVSTVYDSDDSYADTNGECGKGLTWSYVDADKKLTISKSSAGTGAMNDYTGASKAPWSSLAFTSVVIEDGVTSIGSCAFDGRTVMTSVTIPNSVTSIGPHAFNDCRSLTSVTIPNSVTSIGDAVFNVCSKLTSVTIPDSVTSIADYTFGGCIVLTSVIIPNSVTSIGNYAFQDCEKLTSITIPNSVTSIGNNAFNRCFALTSIVIPDSVTSIGHHAFNDCKGLTSVTIPNSVTSISDAVFNVCSKLTSVTIPNSVTSIGNNAFSSSGLTSVTIPNSATSIGNNAFQNCKGLTFVSIPDSVTSIGDNAFSGCTKLVDVALTSTTSSPNKTMSNGVLSGNKLAGMPNDVERIIIDGYVDLKGLSSNTSPSFKLIFAGGVTKDHVTDSSDSTATSDIRSDDELAGSVYKYSEGKWVKDTSVTACTVTFDANGGSCISKRVTLVNLKIALPTPVKVGYNFEGWHVSSGLSDAAVSATEYTVSGDITLYAKYTEKEYTLTYKANGGTGADISETIKYSKLCEGYTLKPANTFTAPAGKVFLGWAIGSSSLYNADATISDKVLGSNVTVSAFWSFSVKVTFDADGGSVDQTYKTVICGGRYGDLPIPVAIAGKFFDGWYLNGAKITSSSVVPLTTDHMLVASWLSTSYTGHDVKVTFDSKSTFTVDSKVVKYGYCYGGLPIPIKEKCIFDGWYLNGTKITALSTVKTYSDHTLVAKWLDSTYGADTTSDDVQDQEFPTVFIIAGISVAIFASVVAIYAMKGKN